MSGSRVLLQPVLEPSEYRALDAFASAHRGREALPEIAAFLAEHFGVEFTLDHDIVAGFAQDSSNLPGSAQALCRPSSERECAVALRACRRAGIPVTISGGRTNLTGSATPSEGLVLSTAKMLTPEPALDAGARSVAAPVGIPLEDLREFVLRRSGRALVFPVDPTSRKEAWLGGALACNASGFTPGETGAIRAWVEGVRFLLPDGLLVEARRGEWVSENGAFTLAGAGSETRWPVPSYPRPRIKNAGGPWSAPDGRADFIDLVVGSEGIFGLVTACRLRLMPRVPDHLDFFISLPGEAEAIRLLMHVSEKLGNDPGALSAFEYFGVNCRHAMLHEDRFFRGADQVGVYIQAPLREPDPGPAAEQWLEIFSGAGCGIDADKVLMLDTDALRTLFFEARHSLPANALEIVKKRGTHTIMTDTVVPRGRFKEFLEFTHGRLAAEKLEYVAFGHLGDCHLHFTILPDKDSVQRAVDVYDGIVAKSADLGGVYSGEHGTGKRKRRDFLRCYGQAAVEQVRRSKAALDPEFLLNRGNVVTPS